jgi:hypothetical protein
MSTDSNYVYEKGTILVAPGGGGAFTPLAPGAANQALFANPAEALGVAWGAGDAMGNVVGPVSSTAHNLAAFADTSGVLLEDSGIATDLVAIGPGSSTANHVAAFDDTDGVTLIDSGLLYTEIAKGPGSSTANNFASFSDTDGLTLADSGYNHTSFRPAPVTGGSAATKGSFTLSSGTHAQIATTAAVTGAVIVFTVVTLGTVTVASAFECVIQNGVGFTPTASQSNDTSVVNWAIVA